MELYNFKVVLIGPKGKTFIVTYRCENLKQLHDFLQKEHAKWKIESIIGG